MYVTGPEGTAHCGIRVHSCTSQALNGLPNT